MTLVEEHALYLRDPAAWCEQIGAAGLVAAIERDRMAGNEAGARRRWRQAGPELRAVVERITRKAA